MHQMRILTNDVSTVMLRPKTLEIRNIVKTVESREKEECHKMEPNPSKERAMSEGDDSLF
jgi:hypothetical protein